MRTYLDKIFSIKGKTAIITGCSRGIGSEIALAFLRSDANIVGVSRSERPDNNELEAYYKQCDISNMADFKEVCQYTNKKFGKIDILVNTAGISIPTNNNLSNIDRFTTTLSINLTSIYQCCDISSKYMINGGVILNITSIGSMLGFPDNPGYIASKGGLSALTRSLAVDYADSGIRVNNIVPGYTRTAMTENSYKNELTYKERLERMLIKRWGNTDDFIGAAIFLASDASSYITGTDIIIDGGWAVKGL